MGCVHDAAIAMDVLTTDIDCWWQSPHEVIACGPVRGGSNAVAHTKSQSLVGSPYCRDVRSAAAIKNRLKALQDEASSPSSSSNLPTSSQAQAMDK